jgi:hypothetical protein
VADEVVAALKDDRLVFAYQPIIDAVTREAGRVRVPDPHGAGSTARWRRRAISFRRPSNSGWCVWSTGARSK